MKNKLKIAAAVVIVLVLLSTVRLSIDEDRISVSWGIVNWFSDEE